MTAMTGPDHAVSPDCDLFGGQVAYPRHNRQMPLPLGWGQNDPARFSDFLIGDSNAEAVRHIERFAHWNSPASVLVGPPSSGRTTLGRLFVAASGGAVVDTLEDADPVAVFHAWNRAANEQTRLLVVVGDELTLDRLPLADLRTRLATGPVVRFSTPDLQLAAALIDRLLTERGLIVPPAVSSYVAARIERSYLAIHACVSAIDAAALSLHAPLSVPLARAAMITSGLMDNALDDVAYDRDQRGVT